MVPHNWSGDENCFFKFFQAFSDFLQLSFIICLFEVSKLDKCSGKFRYEEDLCVPISALRFLSRYGKTPPMLTSSLQLLVFSQIKDSRLLRVKLLLS